MIQIPNAFVLVVHDSEQARIVVGPVYIKCQRQHGVNVVTTLGILVSLKTMETNRVTRVIAALTLR